nr:hypothetical protein Iba_chr04cCG6330 [Ipomoea batatas]GME16242.1 hypothetical protein Iba_scaffold17236CG0060 [Ipomoea batatas]
MASLVLLISELLKHESIDTLLSSSSGAKSCAAMVARNSQSYGYNRDSNNSSTGFNGNNNNKAEEVQEELPRICVDLVWP